MKRKAFLIKIVALLLLLSLLAGCGELHQAVGTGNDEATSSEETTTTDGGAVGDDESDMFTVSLVYNGKAYIPKDEMGVRWSDGKSVHEAQFGEDGIAKIGGLDGDYQVTLTSLPDKYTYNPNIYVATNDMKNVVIELHKYKTAKRGGDNVYKGITAKELGVYRAELTSDSHIIYYDFEPRQSGTYTIESWVDVTANIVNPLCDTYNGTASKYFDRTHDTGGICSTYTKNFKVTIEVDEQMIGNVYTIGVKAMANASDFPVIVDFAIQLDGGFTYPWGSSDIIVPSQMDDINWDAINAIEGDVSGKSFVGPEKKIGVDSAGQDIMAFDEDDFGYDENLGCYRKKNPITGELDGPVLYAYISQPCRFIDTAFTQIEYKGNKNLTLNGGTENYKLFIEGFTALITDPPALEIGPYFCIMDCPCRQFGNCPGACTPGCLECSVDCRPCPEEGIGNPGYTSQSKNNSIGVVPVTRELKDFLQKYSIAQKLFNDGEGWVETQGHIYAGEEDQWLFACGYFE